MLGRSIRPWHTLLYLSRLGTLVPFVPYCRRARIVPVLHGVLPREWQACIVIVPCSVRCCSTTIECAGRSALLAFPHSCSCTPMTLTRKWLCMCGECWFVLCSHGVLALRSRGRQRPDSMCLKSAPDVIDQKVAGNCVTQNLAVPACVPAVSPQVAWF